MTDTNKARGSLAALGKALDRVTELESELGLANRQLEAIKKIALYPPRDTAILRILAVGEGSQ